MREPEKLQKKIIEIDIDKVHVLHLLSVGMLRAHTQTHFLALPVCPSPCLLSEAERRIPNSKLLNVNKATYVGLRMQAPSSPEEGR